MWVKMSFDWMLAISYHTGSLHSYQHQLAKSWQHLRQTQSNRKYRRRKTEWDLDAHRNTQVSSLLCTCLRAWTISYACIAYTMFVASTSLPFLSPCRLVSLTCGCSNGQPGNEDICVHFLCNLSFSWLFLQCMSRVYSTFFRWFNDLAATCMRNFVHLTCKFRLPL